MIAVAMGVMNVATYGYTILAARALGPQSYGAFAAVMNLLLVVSVVSLALQATAARRISADPEHVAQIEAGVLRVTLRAAFGLGLLLLLLAPVVNIVLRLESLTTAALVGLIAVPVTMMGGQAGILQGERRWKALAAIYVAAGVPRLAIGSGLIVWRPEELTATVGVLIGAIAPVLVGLVVLRAPRVEGRLSEQHGSRSILRESALNSQALLAFFALSNADVIVARNVLDAQDAGLYAAGVILTKAVLFLPQFVVVIAFPNLATVHERRRALTLSLLLVGVLGLVAIAGALLLSPVAMVFVGGGEYAEIEPRLWLFAVLGTLLAMLQLLVYAVLARRGQRSTYALWLALAAVIGVGMLSSSLEMLLAVVVSIDAVLFAALLATSLYGLRRSELRGRRLADDSTSA